MVYYYSDTLNINMVDTTLHINPEDSSPLWKQIESEIHRLVALGALESNTAIPSVRELAKTLRVNPATVSKAYQRLTRSGILEVRRGEGTFVAQSIPRLEPEVVLQELNASARKFANHATTLGVAPSEALNAIEVALESLKPIRRDHHD